MKGEWEPCISAKHPLIGKQVAVKILLPEFSQNQEVITRFFNEARATTLLKHPGLIEVFDFGNHTSGSAFIVMELLEGASLANRLRQEQTLSLEFLIELVRQIAVAVTEAHRKNIVHRDLKPENVFLVPDPQSRFGVRVKVLDFGIAKLANGLPNAMRTRAGVVLGTPTYMSPEQCHGAPGVDHRTDIYALGCMVFEMATGRAPYVGKSAGEVLAGHICQPIPSVRTLVAAAPEGLDRIVLRAMAKRVEDRYSSMDELVADLEALLRRAGAAAFQSRPSEGGSSYPTTLSSSSGQVMGTPRPAGRLRAAAPYKRMTGMAIGIGAVLVLCIIGLVASRLVSHRLEQAPSPEPVRAVSEPLGQLAKLKAPQDALSKHIHLDSTPSGAQVSRASDGTLLGVTPLDVPVSTERSRNDLAIHLSGYSDQRVSLDTGTSNSETISLSRTFPDPPKQLKHRIRSTAKPKSSLRHPFGN